MSGRALYVTTARGRGTHRRGSAEGCGRENSIRRADTALVASRRVLRAPLRGCATRSPAERDLLGGRSGGARPASPARRAPATDQTPQAASQRQTVPLGDEQDAASGALGGVHREPGHARAVAPRARPAQVDVPASSFAGTPAIDPETRALILRM